MSDRAGYALIAILLASVFGGLVYSSADEPTPLTIQPSTNDQTEKETNTMSVGNGAFGNAWTAGSPENLVDLIADNGGQHIIMWCGDESLDYNTMFNWTNNYNGEILTYTQFLTRIRDEATVKGIKLGLQWVIDTQTKIDIINNVDGKQTTYINLYKTIVTTFQPDFVDVLNEVIGDEVDGSGSASFLVNYAAFLESCIDGLRSVSSLGNNLIAVVSSVPFWNLAYVTANPVAKVNCVYAVHAYYTWDNAYPAAWEVWNRAYWDAETEQDFIDAKALLVTDLFNNIGITAAENAGLTVFMEETGCNTATPNYLRVMADYWDVCVSAGLNFSSQCAPWSYYIPQFTSAGALTSLGDVWVDYVSSDVVSAPTFNPVAGTYSEAQNVAVSCATASSTIYYTADGSTPTAESTLYESPIAILTGSKTLKALGVKEGLTNSSIASAYYVIQESPPEVYFEDDVETGNLTAWTEGPYNAGEGAACSATDTQKYAGTYSVKASVPNIASAYSLVGCDLTAERAVTYTTAWVRFSALPAASGKIAFFELVANDDPTFTHTANVCVFNDSGNYKISVYYYTNSGYIWGTSDAVTLAINTWYQITFKIAHNVSNGEVSAWINGVQVLSVTGIANSNLNTYFAFVGGQHYVGYSAIDVYFDNVNVSSQYNGASPTPAASIIPLLAYHNLNNIRRM